jgi:hypothetical protein
MRTSFLAVAKYKMVTPSGNRIESKNFSNRWEEKAPVTRNGAKIILSGSGPNARGEDADKRGDEYGPS